eukprot:533072_1
MATYCLLILMMCIINVLSYRDGDIIADISPPFGEVANQLYDNPEIIKILDDPYHYRPSFGKAGIAFTIIYYIRNARLAIQYIHDPINFHINSESHNDIWSKMFQWEMDIFSTFRTWYDDNSNIEKWNDFILTTYEIFNYKIKTYLIHFRNNNEVFRSLMPIFEDNYYGPKYLTKSDITSSNKIPSKNTFNK